MPKLSKRTLARRCALQLMYQSEITENDVAQVIETFWKSAAAGLDDVVSENGGEKLTVTEPLPFAEELFRNACARSAEYDRIISQFLKSDWTVDRLSSLELNILRLAIYELMESDTPFYAIMKDYVWLANSYADEKSASFVNGLLDKVRVSFKPESSKGGTVGKNAETVAP